MADRPRFAICSNGQEWKANRVLTIPRFQFEFFFLCFAARKRASCWPRSALRAITSPRFSRPLSLPRIYEKNHIKFNACSVLTKLPTNLLPIVLRIARALTLLRRSDLGWKKKSIRSSGKNSVFGLLDLKYIHTIKYVYMYYIFILLYVGMIHSLRIWFRR